MEALAVKVEIWGSMAVQVELEDQPTADFGGNGGLTGNAGAANGAPSGIGGNAGPAHGGNGGNGANANGGNGGNGGSASSCQAGADCQNFVLALPL